MTSDFALRGAPRSGAELRGASRSGAASCQRCASISGASARALAERRRINQRSQRAARAEPTLRSAGASISGASAQRWRSAALAEPTLRMRGTFFVSNEAAGMEEEPAMDEDDLEAAGAAGAPVAPTPRGGETLQDGLPGVAPAKDIFEVVRRLELLTIPQSDTRVVPDLSKFEPWQVVGHFTQVLEDKHVLMKEESAVGETKATIEWRPAFDHTKFFMHPETREVYGVHTRAMQTEMTARGYTPLQVDFPGSFPGLPPRLNSAQVRSTTRPSLPIGCFTPTIQKGKSAAPISSQVVHMFEVETRDPANPETRYAALRHWPLGASREELNDQWKQLTTDDLSTLRDHINRYAHVYVLCVSEDVHVQHSLNVGQMSMDALKQAARAHFPSKATPTEPSGASGASAALPPASGAAASAAATPAKKKRKTQSWFDFACELAADRAN